MENKKRRNEVQQKHVLFQEKLKFNNLIKQSELDIQKLKKVNRFQSQSNNKNGYIFNVPKHFYYLKQNHAHFTQLGYSVQNNIQNSYLENLKNQKSFNKGTNSNITLNNRRISLKKSQLSHQVKFNPSISSLDTSKVLYWNVKQANEKLNHWKK